MMKGKLGFAEYGVGLLSTQETQRPNAGHFVISMSLTFRTSFKCFIYHHHHFRYQCHHHHHHYRHPQLNIAKLKLFRFPFHCLSSTESLTQLTQRREEEKLMLMKREAGRRKPRRKRRRRRRRGWVQWAMYQKLEEEGIFKIPHLFQGQTSLVFISSNTSYLFLNCCRISSNPFMQQAGSRNGVKQWPKVRIVGICDWQKLFHCWCRSRRLLVGTINLRWRRTRARPSSWSAGSTRPRGETKLRWKLTIMTSTPLLLNICRTMLEVQRRLWSASGTSRRSFSGRDRGREFLHRSHLLFSSFSLSSFLCRLAAFKALLLFKPRLQLRIPPAANLSTLRLQAKRANLCQSSPRLETWSEHQLQLPGLRIKIFPFAFYLVLKIEPLSS